MELNSNSNTHNETNNRSVNLSNLNYKLGERQSTSQEASFILKNDDKKSYLSKLAQSKKFQKKEEEPQEDPHKGARLFDAVGRYNFYKGNRRNNIGFGDDLDIQSFDSSDEERFDKFKEGIKEQALLIGLDNMKRTGISPSMFDLKQDVGVSFNLEREGQDELSDDDNT